MSVAAKLKELRLESGDSLQKVADAVGASKAHIWEVETGKIQRPSMELVQKLADHFRVSTAKLIGEDPNAEDEEEELVVLFRELKSLDERDRDTIRRLIRGLKDEN